MLLNRSRLFVVFKSPCQGLLLRQLSSETQEESVKSKGKWDLYAGVLLERQPVITKELRPIEKKVLVSLILFLSNNLLMKVSFRPC